MDTDAAPHASRSPETFLCTTTSGGCWDIYVGVHLIRENLTKVVVPNQDSFHERVK